MILKGRIFHFLDKGNIDNPENSFEYIEKGGLVISGEKIIDIEKIEDYKNRWLKENTSSYETTGEWDEIPSTFKWDVKYIKARRR